MTFINIIDDFLEIRPNYQLIIAGDFNNFRNEKLCNDLVLENLVDKYTRKQSILDHIIGSKDIFYSYKKGSITYDAPLGNADHCVISIIPMLIPVPLNVRSCHTVLDYRRCNRSCLK